MSWFRVGVFLAAVTAVVGGIHYYLWARLVRDLAWPDPWPAVGVVALALLALSLPGGMVARRLMPRVVGPALAWPLFVWMGLMWMLLSALVARDVAWLAFEAGRWLAGSDLDPTGELRLARLTTGGAVAATAGVAALGLVTARRGAGVKRVRVPVDGLPAGYPGLRIVQISDVHVGPTIGLAFVEELVRRVNELSPDVVAITGDLVDGSVAELGPAVEPLRRLRARHGVFFVTGNHEYYSGVAGWLELLPRLGVRVLRNERVTIDHEGARIDLAGVDDWASAAFGGGHGPDLRSALAGRDPSIPLVLLAHQPKAVEEASELGVSLQLSGHTHGGQIFPFRYLVRLAQPYVSGLHRHGRTWLYVSNGTGYWGPPMRVGAPPEITLVELEPAGHAR